MPVFLDPPLNLDLDGDLAAATQRLATELPDLVEEHGASIVVSPSPHDVHHGHEAVGRGVQRAMAALPPDMRWWMWGVWGDLPAPNVFYGFDQAVLDRALHILDAYAGELERNDYRPFLTGRAAANAVMGSERVFGFGSPAASQAPLRRGGHRGAPARRPLHGLRAALPRPGPRALGPLRRRPHAVARLAERARAGRLHPGGARGEPGAGSDAPTTTLTPQLVEDFRRDGFVVVPDLLSADERRRYGSAVDEAVGPAKQARHAGTGGEVALRAELHPVPEPVGGLRRRAAADLPPLVAETAARLLGVDAVRLWHDQALYKEAGGRETDPHQDQPYWPIVETNTITAWIPFDGSTLESGAMGYLPGSHRLGLREFVNIFTGATVTTRWRGEELAGIEPVFVEVPPGAVAFHHGLTFHLARPNATGTVRRVHTVIYFADGSTRGEGRFPHPSVERAGIALGAVIASDITPLAWPRPEGDLPDPPAAPLG